jgi:hypothetical protein
MRKSSINLLENEDIVDSNNVDIVDALRLELCKLLYVSWYLVRACSAEGGRDADDEILWCVSQPNVHGRYTPIQHTLPVKLNSKGVSAESSLTLIPAGIVAPGAIWALLSKVAAAECAACAAEVRTLVIVGVLRKSR